MSTQLDRLTAALADRYAIEREIGAGGMATVYLARDLKHDRQVAVKVLRPDLAAAMGAERFLREIKIAARLHHPHILQLYDSGNWDIYWKAADGSRPAERVADGPDHNNTGATFWTRDGAWIVFRRMGSPIRLPGSTCRGTARSLWCSTHRAETPGTPSWC